MNRNNKRMDRRDFIKKSAMAVAAVAATSLLNSPVMAAVNEYINNDNTNKTMKKILILNGSSRRNGYTSALVDAFAEGAKSNGNEVKEHFIHGMKVNYCLGCDMCMKTQKGCVQKTDDMNTIYGDLTWADVIVFASPEYWGTFTAELKTVIDRMFGWFNLDTNGGARKDVALLMTARGNDYSMALDQYHVFTKYLEWKDLGMVLGRGKVDEARRLGESIK